MTVAMFIAYQLLPNSSSEGRLQGCQKSSFSLNAVGSAFLQPAYLFSFSSLCRGARKAPCSFPVIDVGSAISLPAQLYYPFVLCRGAESALDVIDLPQARSGTKSNVRSHSHVLRSALHTF